MTWWERKTRIKIEAILTEVIRTRIERVLCMRKAFRREAAAVGAWSPGDAAAVEGREVKTQRKRTRAHGGCLWLSEATKDVISCEKPR